MSRKPEQRPCSICGKLCYCKKLAGVCADCRGYKKRSTLARIKAEQHSRERKRGRLTISKRNVNKRRRRT